MLNLFCFSSHVSHLLFYFLVQGYDEEDGETDEAWNRMNEVMSANVTAVGIFPQPFFFYFLCTDFFSHLTRNFHTATLTPYDW